MVREHMVLVNHLYLNSIEKSKNLSKKFKPFAKDITLFGTNKTKGSLVNKTQPLPLPYIGGEDDPHWPKRREVI